MDRQSEELGGKASFFAGEFKKYRWAQLLDKRYSGSERLRLYAEGIEKMNVNKNIPQLFRDIFKGVFLPYRDPETLNLFLKEIDGFTYEHSERLGDAFEYLLSVLGTQGDAGQFRTPRHIIDFIVAVVDPKKHETILDPACGTAGFLISAYKHILRMAAKSKGRDPSIVNSSLTPDERARLMTNFRGYDIAPDMVRLSRVNLYLHGFQNPVIHEYDTLTSEERWDECCDVILANPPFMTPKGGIRPHNRFSIKAKRSEVLFVDYIAEHLNPGGRARVIVPEGIIFQSQNAYKALRKMLVENYLWAVVSLPAGVFNPYSGVKTSILLLDRNLARMDNVLFVKVENDGFDLGAQRRPVEGSQLSEALRILEDYKKAPKDVEGKMALTVSRKRLLESADMNFSGERYRVAALKHSGKWPMVKLGEVCEMVYGLTATAKDLGDARFIRITDISVEGSLIVDNPKFVMLNENSHKYLLKPGDLLVARTGATYGKTLLFSEHGNAVFASYLVRIRFEPNTFIPQFYWFLTQSNHYWQQARSLVTGGGQPQFNANALCKLVFPLPPIKVQERIVTELEVYRKVIEGARQILASYKPTIRVDLKWPMKQLGMIARNLDGKRVPIEKGQRKPGSYPYYGASGIVDYVDDFIFDGDFLLISEDGANLLARSTPIAFSVSGKVWVNNHAHVLQFENSATRQFIEYYINDLDIQDFVTGAAQPKLNQANMNRIPIPLPPLDVQRRIVTKLEMEQKLVESNRELIKRMEAKISAKLNEVWGDEDLAKG